MRHIIQAQPPIIATQPTTGSNQIAARHRKRV